MYVIHVQDEGLYKLYKSRKGKYTAIRFLYIIVILNNNITKANTRQEFSHKILMFCLCFRNFNIVVS